MQSMLKKNDKSKLDNRFVGEPNDIGIFFEDVDIATNENITLKLFDSRV